MRFTCSICRFATQRFLTLIKHYRHGHNETPFHCDINGCKKLHNTSRQYLRHIKSKHLEFWMEHCTARCIQEPNQALIDNDLRDNDGMNDGPLQNGLEDDDVEIDVNHDVGALLLGLREEHKTSSEACSFVARNVSEIIKSFREDVIAKVKDIGIEQEALNQLHASLLSESQYERAFNDLSTQSSLEKYATEHFDYVQPEEYVLGQNVKGEDETFQYVSVIDTVKALLKQEDVFAEVYNGHSSVNDTLGDFCDGINFKQNELFSTKDMAIQIQLYFDEFCVANPLGNKVKQMKFAAVYFILGNISPKHRSKLHVIQLATLCLASHVQKYTLDVILAPLLRDIQTLETEGIDIIKDGIAHTFHGTVSFISADNLGAHMIGGYQTHFNSGRVCRWCNVTSASLKLHLNLGKLQTRTKEAYRQQIANIAENPNLASVYGLKKDSPFNQLQYFHVTDGLAGDIAHDLFEGIIPEVVQLTVKHCVEQGYFTLQYFNNIIHTFPYGDSDVKNKPSPMSSVLGTFKVKQTAAQAWCLLRLLPIMVGHSVPCTDERWLVLLLLLDIVEYCTAPVVNKVMADFLSFLIELFTTRYYREYEDITMKPKFHYLIHYPQMMMEFGPLVHCWTLRFEGKHFTFKQISWRTKNRKNLTRTLAERHEYLQAWHRSKWSFLTSETVEHSGGKLCHVRELSKEMQQLVVTLVGHSETVYMARKVAYNGTWYTSGSAIVLGKDRFGVISTSLIIAGVVYLVYEQMQTVDYIQHIHAYAISSDAHKLQIVKVTELHDHQPLAIYTTQFSKCVVLRYHIL